LAPDDPYYGRDLSLIHHLGFGFHADACAPGILRLLEPVPERGGLVLELGCGSGLLTTYLLDAGHRVVATDASPAMLDLGRDAAAGADLRLLTLPDDPLPEADAIVGVGHVLNYLPSVAAIERGLAAIGRARRVVAAGRRAPRQRADRDRSRARAPGAGRRRGSCARVVRGRGAASGPARGRRAPACLTRLWRAVPVGDPGQHMLGDCSPAAEARETVAETLVGLADRQVEGTTIGDRLHENSPALYFALPPLLRRRIALRRS
jgi:SAM-dependent methyltransferase